MKRKRASLGSLEVASKRLRVQCSATPPDSSAVKLLKQYYNSTTTLRDFLLQRISSKQRRRTIGKYTDVQLEEASDAALSSGSFLDNVLVGCRSNDDRVEQGLLKQQFITFWRERCPRGSVRIPELSDVLDFCSRKLQQRSLDGSMVKHALLSAQHTAPRGISHEQASWQALPSIVGCEDAGVLVELFLNCGIFERAAGDDLVQISGPLMNDLAVISQSQDRLSSEKAMNKTSCRYTEITIARYRMLYARSGASNGRLHSGLDNKHCLSVHGRDDVITQAQYVLPLIFPQQYTKHDSNNPEKRGVKHKATRAEPERPPRIPRRLFGNVSSMVASVCRKNRLLSYKLLLQHYCRRPERIVCSAPVGMSVPQASVSAFCRASVRALFGVKTFGGQRNWQLISKSIDRLVRLRRYEQVSLHEILNGIRIVEIAWLAPKDFSPGQKLSRSDFEKRKELFSQFLVFLFDQYLIPLIRAHFHVTESSSYRNRLLYFRHDVWEALSTPTLNSMKNDMFEACKALQMQKMIEHSSLGVSSVRLAPKDSGMRPIINLRRKVVPDGSGGMRQGRSINNVLAPAFAALSYEKVTRPELLGSAVFSAEEMLPKLLDFRHCLRSHGHRKPLYFARLDVKSCFDTLPHEKLIQVARRMLKQDTYTVHKHTRGRLLGINKPGEAFRAQPVWRYTSEAASSSEPPDLTNKSTADRNGAVLLDLAKSACHDRQALLRLLEEHITCNLVKINGRIYRQKRGIAQGSVVASLLCSLLYAELEEEIFGYMDYSETRLIRLIDDFLVMTTRREVAENFMRIMHAGMPTYGVEVKYNKSLVNFDLSLGSHRIPRLPVETDFPYCGQTINTVSLDVGRDAERRDNAKLRNSITVQYGRHAGLAFQRNALQTLRLQMRKMLISTEHNSAERVWRNLHEIMTEVAGRMYHYLRSMPSAKLPSEKLVIDAVCETVQLAKKVVRKHQPLMSTASVQGNHVEWLACDAFGSVFQEKQTQYQALLGWLRKQQDGHLP